MVSVGPICFMLYSQLTLTYAEIFYNSAPLSTTQNKNLPENDMPVIINHATLSIVHSLITPFTKSMQSLL